MINIRKANQDDIPRIVALYEELTEETINASRDAIQEVFTEIVAMPNQHFLVVEKDDFVLGTLFLQIVPNLSHDASPWANIENVVIDSRYRGQGFGRILMEQAFAICREAGCYKVQLMSNVKRKEAHQFYRSMGFENSAIGFRLHL
jgi:N-acetylglutamate synthase-like GNAT family acetyltransferase